MDNKNVNNTGISIQWYPGHMAKTKRLLAENIKLVDIVIEVLDARIPFSSRNPDLDALCSGKKRITLLNKSDLADQQSSRLWLTHFARRGIPALCVNSSGGKGVKETAALARTLMADRIEAQRKRGRTGITIRLMIAGIPNSGKSTFINRLAGREAAKAADKPGVTRGRQWVKIASGLELLDTPGILWPKFDDTSVGLHLAFTGAINDNIMDMTLLAAELLHALKARYPDASEARYGVRALENEPELDTLGRIALARGCLLKKGEPDLARAAAMLIDEFRGGKLGAITLELPDD